MSRPPDGTERLIALLEQLGTSDPAVRQVIRVLCRTPEHLTDQFDHWQTIVDAVGAQQAACMILDTVQAAHKRWAIG